MQVYDVFIEKLERNAAQWPIEEFNQAMKYMYRGIDMLLQIEDKILFIEYFMQCIRKDLQADMLTRGIYTEEGLVGHLSHIFPYTYLDENNEEHSLESLALRGTQIMTREYTLLPAPWRLDRLTRLLPSIYKQGWGKGHQQVFVYKQLGIGTVSNGNHSLAVEVYLNGNNCLKADIFDVAPLFAHLYSNGVLWKNVHTDQTLRKEVPDFRIAILYEAAKLKFQLEQESCPKSS